MRIKTSTTILDALLNIALSLLQLVTRGGSRGFLRFLETHIVLAWFEIVLYCLSLSYTEACLYSN